MSLSRLKEMGIRTGLVLGALAVWILSSWITHVVVCLKSGAWGFLIAGALFFPIAVVHGTGVWLGVW